MKDENMRVTVAVVARDEERYLPELLGDIEGQSYPHELIEVLLIEGGSVDATRELMESFAGKHDDFLDVKVLDNDGKQSRGWNIAIAEFSTEALVRVDAHARIAPDFVEKTVEAFKGGEDVVGGTRPTMTASDDTWSRILWMAEESMFGSSILAGRREGTSSESTAVDSKGNGASSVADRKGRYVKTLFHAGYRREVFEKVGGFREDLGRTEDNEFHYRVRTADYRIYMSPDIHSYQYVRPTLRGMLRQKAGNGFWIGKTLKICPKCLSLYHFVPAAFVLAIVACVVLAILGFPWLLQLLAAMYISVAVLMAVFSVIGEARQGRAPVGAVFALPVVFFLLHVVYGCATLVGVFAVK